MVLRHAFTLIELLISITLGALIVAVAVAGFRVTGQSITLANRLSLQNAVLRAAVVAANEEMDFWDSFDSRTDPSRQILRGGTYPFSRMSFTSTTNGELKLSQHEPRLWWSGHLWSSNDKRFGDYSIFGRQMLIDPAVPPERIWRHSIIKNISDNMGYYALFDYLPANFVYGFYDEAGTIPTEFGIMGNGPGRFRSNWHGRNAPLSKIEYGHDNGCILTNTVGVPGYPHTHPVCHRASYNDSNGSGFTDTLYPDRFDAFPVIDFANALPSLWPTVKMQVKVTYQWMDFRHQVRIQQTDPYTGQTTTMVVHGMTTTLRGARRQRGLDIEPADTDYP
jgi:prepilin-type N-terminal cleavage/methylation domain-containing protein